MKSKKLSLETQPDHRNKVFEKSFIGNRIKYNVWDDVQSITKHSYWDVALEQFKLTRCHLK